jgi:hypothetical protein
MSAKLVLYFTAAGHALYRPAAGALELEARFAADEAGLAAFRTHLQGRRGALVTVLADLTGEDFHEDQIPYLRGNDRRTVIERRLAQRYRDTRLAAAISLGNVSDERRSERLLLASFTNTQQFTAWLDALAESGARLSGVYSVPLLAPALAARLGVKGGRAFVVTVNGTGLRQCYVDEGRLRFARLERAPGLEAETLAAFARAETLRLVQYLSTLRTLPREGPPVQVVVVAPTGQRAAFERALVSDTRLSFLTLDLAEAARRTGVKRLPADGAGEHLFLQLALRNPPREQFARGEDRRGYFLWQLQRGLGYAAVAAFAACALYAGALWAGIVGTRGQVEAQRAEAERATQEYQRITASFPVTQTSTDNLRATVVEFTRIASASASPEPALAYLSQVMDKFPQMDLDSVTWYVGKPGGAPDAPAAAAATPKGPGASAVKPAAPADVMQVLEVSGRVNAIRRSDYRAITGEVQRFAAALRGDPAWTLLRTQLPFDVTPEGTLTGDIGSGEGTEAPRFTIAVGRKLK